MDRWKESFEELLNVKCERQTEDVEEEDIQKQKEEMRNEVIIIEEVIEVVHLLNNDKAVGHDNCSVLYTEQR